MQLNNHFRLTLFFLLVVFIAPPVFAAIDQDKLNSCLCNEGCAKVGWDCFMVSCYYNPAAVDASPECLDTSKGECVCQGYGCGRAPKPSSGELYDKCVGYQQPKVPTIEELDAECKRDNGPNAMYDTTKKKCQCVSGYVARGGFCVVDEKKTCDNSCGFGVEQKPYPDCSCVEQKPADLCKDVKCYGFCETPKNDYHTANHNGVCNPQTGICEYQQTKCSVGCSTTPDGKDTYCNEDCDNGLDDDRNGYADCADNACKTSLYCSCKSVGMHSGTMGGRTLKFVVGSYNFKQANFYYTYLDRDLEAEADAKIIYNSLSSTVPFSESNVEVYVTRLPSYTLGPWRSDLIAKCKDVGADVTIFVDQNTFKTSNSRAFSMNADMYKSSIPKQDFGATVMHEIGHGFGGLWDEYTIAEEINLPVGTLAVIRDTIYSSAANCAATSVKTDCDQYFSKFGIPYQCVKGCSAGAWYRSSDESIMRYPDKSSEFNLISQSLIRNRITSLVNPPKYVVPANFGGWQEPDMVR